VAATRISTTSGRAIHPAAAFRNDSLFVVWEDYRNGEPDIYGTAIPVRTSLSVESHHEAPSSSRIVSIIPNPANTSATVDLMLRGAGSVEVIDSRGETQFHISTTSERIVIDTRSLPGGIYRLVLRSEGEVDSEAMIVVR
jgi:hypothetical protein